NRYFLNSFIVSTIVTIGNVIFCFGVAYTLARWKSKLSDIMMLTIISVLMIPAHVIMIPLYRLMVSFSWIDTYKALIIPWLITPFGIFLVKQYIEKIPVEIENAARIDGANNFQILSKIVFPISRPILTVLAIYTFLGNWNVFLFPFLFTNSEDMRTLPVGLTFYLGKQSIDWGHLMAGASISALPIIVLYLLFRKKIIRGLIAGSLKG
ncbi:carbohydrate ABC transporter permease, partial [Candidatus Kapabacteria bacterium]|nr:carbohydrate ABC transporter permease [Candidatus Kapabacteria bacterium]